MRCGSTYEDTCTFSIQPTLAGEQLLEDGLEVEVDYAPFEAKVFKFHIPARRANVEDAMQIKSIVITAVPLLPMDEKMNLYATTKGAINPKKQQRKGTSGWRKGQTLRLSEEDLDEWCTDCFVTILLDVTAAGKYQIQTRTNIGISQI